MSRRNRRQTPTTLRDRQPLRVSLAAAVLAGQRLRADETASATTFSLGFAAKWAQAKGGAR